ncbi:MAG TPA: response regulator transcription factor [Trueperaceae bacterium]|nr:response regulator transcription factor [Trueperaceae bacterium]
MNNISLIVVDDHELVREGICNFLETKDDLKVLAQASSGYEAIDLVRQHQPDIVLMDLRMEGLDGVEATRIIKEQNPRIRVIILSSYHDDEYIFPALRAGANSFILKDIGAQELVEAIYTTFKGDTVLNPQIASRILRDTYGPKSIDANPFVELTKRELEILKLIAYGKNNTVISNELKIAKGTVKGHVTNILSKLNLHDRTQAAVYAWQEGIVRRK